MVPKSWWVWLFLFACGLGLRIANERRDALYLSLQAELKEASSKIITATERQEELQLQLQSQSDPAWIELTLMRWLGLVPEGQTKVYFKEIQ